MLGLFFHSRKKWYQRKIFWILFLLFMGIVSFLFFYTNGINQRNSSTDTKKKFIVKTGESSEEISKKLMEAGLIRSSVFFDIYAWKTGLDTKLQAGEYEIPENFTIREIIHYLSAARQKQQNKIIVIEGWKNSEISDYFEKQRIMTQKEFQNVTSRRKSFWNEYDFLSKIPRNADLEGYLFPDTYLIYKDAAPEDVARKMLDNFEKKFTMEMYEAAYELGMSIHEIITLASIIEKEVTGEEDRAMVSGIFHKRLAIGMGLQADSSVNYITGKKNTRSSLEDISLDNPYNTYKYKGLPPGPINNPGLSAIQAALRPKKSSYLYFLTTTDDKVFYGKTFEEHVKNKEKYL